MSKTQRGPKTAEEILAEFGVGTPKLPVSKSAKSLIVARNKTTKLRAKRHIQKTKRNIRRIQRKRSVKERTKIRFTTIVTDVHSPRGRSTFAAAPQVGQPQTPQNIFNISTAIAAYRWDPIHKILQIDFVKGGTYNYFDVSKFTVMSLGRASSKGRYFYYNIRTNFRFERVR